MTERQNSRIKVYLVEDHTLIRESVRARLDVEPTIEVVGDSALAEQALKDLEAQAIDVVLMDIQLPVMDGLEATRRLKEMRPEVAVVVLTAFQDEYIEPAFRAGAAGYILKTSNSQQLIQSIHSAYEGGACLDPSLTRGLIQRVSELCEAEGGSLLSPRQVEILRLVADGTRYSVIAEHLGISVTTVSREMRTIFNRLGANDAAHAVSEAYKRGLLLQED